MRAGYADGASSWIDLVLRHPHDGFTFEYDAVFQLAINGVNGDLINEMGFTLAKERQTLNAVPTVRGGKDLYIRRYRTLCH